MLVWRKLERTLSSQVQKLPQALHRTIWMVKLVCILGLGWISWDMGVLGAMFWT